MRKLLLILLLLTRIAAAAVTSDANSTFTGNFGDSSATWEHTVGAAIPNGLLFASCSTRDTNSRTVTSATYNGTAMTVFNVRLNGGTYFLYTYYLLDANLGTKGTPHDVVFTWSGALAGTAACSAHSFQNVNQAAPFGTIATTTTAATSASTTVTSVSGDLVIDAISTEYSALTVGGSQTELANLSPGAQCWHGVSSLSASGSSTAMTWTWDGVGRYYAQVGVALKVAPVTGGFPVLFQMQRRRQ